MLVGNPDTFAIESRITKAYGPLHLIALGSFQIHVGRLVYGCSEPGASLLAVSLQRVGELISNRGEKVVPFAYNAGAFDLAEAAYHATYASDEIWRNRFGFSREQLLKLFSQAQIDWAPDGDEAFDDGSYVYRFDFGDRVRLIAFISEEGWKVGPGTLREVWIDSDEFYKILADWKAAFLEEWMATEKTPE